MVESEYEVATLLLVEMGMILAHSAWVHLQGLMTTVRKPFAPTSILIVFILVSFDYVFQDLWVIPRADLWVIC